MNNIKRNEFKFVQAIGIIILCIIFMILEFFANDILKIKHPKNTYGEIVDIYDIETSVSPSRKWRHPFLYNGSCEATIIAEYEVDGVKYDLEEKVKLSNNKSFQNSKYSIGKRIKITYNKKKPSISTINELKPYEIVIYIIIGIELLILINFSLKRIKIQKGIKDMEEGNTKNSREVREIVDKW